MIKILVDSCADLSGELLEKYDIDYARMNTVYNGKETVASLTWENYTPAELYGIMRGGERVTTTQVPMEEFNRIFTKYLEEGMDIIYIGCSLKQSGSVNTGAVAAKSLLSNYPGRRIECINSKNASAGEGLLGVYAAELLKEGKSFDEIVEAVNGRLKKVNQFVTVQSLDSLRRAGRVKAGKAFFGNLMGVKPILISDVDGEQTPVKKAKGRLNSLNELVNSLCEVIEDAEKQTVFLAHADCNEQEVEMVRKLILEKTHCKAVETVYMGPIIGASVGPDTMGVWCFGKEVTYRVAAE